MKTFSNPISVLSILLAAFSLAVFSLAPVQVLGQDGPEQMIEQAKKRQAKMMETQYLTMQLSQLSYNKDLQKELEIVGDQAEAVKKLAQSFQQKQMAFHTENRETMAQIHKLMKDGEHSEARELGEKIQDQSKSLSDERMEQLNEILLPHQTKRLLQIAMQRRIKSMNPFNDEFGIPAALADEIGLSKKEKARLMETIEAARKKYYEELETLKKEANEKIMNSLSIEQREKMRDILGDAYDSDKSRRRDSEARRAKQKENEKKLLELQK